MIDILMATYNGEKYIEEQIQSIIKQSITTWKLYVRDDGSTDNTVRIIEKYIEKYVGKIILVRDDKGSLGAKGNFMELLRYSNNDYCMFSDQDDVWLNDKIKDTLSKMVEMESEFDNKTPILVHTNLMVVNEELQVIDNSFWGYMGIDKERIDLKSLALENIVTGCTMMINKSMINALTEIPKECLMHDWWIALVAKICGQIGVVNKATILYRQHENNQVGAKKTIKLGMKKKKYDVFEKEISQIKLLQELYYDEISNENSKIIDILINLNNEKFIKKRYTIVKNKFFVRSHLSNIKNIIGF